MTRRGREAALRIQLLLEEFAPNELSEGLSLLGGANGEDVVEFLVRRIAPSQSQRHLPIHAGRDRDDVMSDLRRTAPEKYDVIREFDMRLRNGTLLPTLDSCRAFGKDLSKDFQAGKSRKDCIGRLIGTLAGMNVEEIRTAISRAPSYADKNSSEPYRRLASHIISGTSR